ncbi:MAG: LodA/GoxA family CTQ-dependent oxidase [Pseudoruegeria sp.]
MTASPIVSVAIHPAIGLSRIGNSADEWFLTPDVRGAAPQDADGYRDADGHIKKQVARFRIFATHADGEVREITADDGEIEWRVEVANLKAGWYEFHYAFDLPVTGIEPPGKRNAGIAGADREALNIRPSRKVISGRNVAGNAFRFDDGTFFDKRVDLGEVRTDDAGRLLFFGGNGTSAPRDAGQTPTTFANNDLWHDDVCDGPVRARVQIGGQTFEATPAHIVVAPPNFGPGLFGIVTMDDVIQDLFIRLGQIADPARPSFTNDIWPLFDRMGGYQWVNDGFLPIVGNGAPLDARDPVVIDKLRDATSAGKAFRQAVVALFRKPGEIRPEALPPIYGDALSDRNASGGLLDPTRQELFLTDHQYQILDAWSAGNFDDDWTGLPDLPAFDGLAPAEQVAHLDRASMYECLGGPFHPGIEITWPFRLETMWEAPYRLKTLPEGQPVRQDYGTVLSVAEALSPAGPHARSGAGSLTRWLGVPWQTDEASCNSGLLYSPGLYLSSPSFWGARVPNQVLSAEAFQLANSGMLSDHATTYNFSKRHLWLRDINATGYLPRINAMVTRWWELGLVEAQESNAGSGLPDICFVETGRRSGPANDPTVQMLLSVLALEQGGLAGVSVAAAAPQTDEEKRDYTTYGRGDI